MRTVAHCGAQQRRLALHAEVEVGALVGDTVHLLAHHLQQQRLAAHLLHDAPAVGLELRLGGNRGEAACPPGVSSLQVARQSPYTHLAHVTTERRRRLRLRPTGAGMRTEHRLAIVRVPPERRQSAHVAS